MKERRDRPSNTAAPTQFLLLLFLFRSSVDRHTNSSHRVHAQPPSPSSSFPLSFPFFLFPPDPPGRKVLPLPPSMSGNGGGGDDASCLPLRSMLHFPRPEEEGDSPLHKAKYRREEALMTAEARDLTSSTKKSNSLHVYIAPYFHRQKCFSIAN